MSQDSSNTSSQQREHCPPVSSSHSRLWARGLNPSAICRSLRLWESPCSAVSTQQMLQHERKLPQCGQARGGVSGNESESFVLSDLEGCRFGDCPGDGWGCPVCVTLLPSHHTPRTARTSTRHPNPPARREALGARRAEPWPGQLHPQSRATAAGGFSEHT